MISKVEESKERNVVELLMLVVSELAEAMEGHRKGLPDDKLAHRSMIEVELAEALIRILDMAEGLGLDLGSAFEEKMAYNAQRADRNPEVRRLPAGNDALVVRNCEAYYGGERGKKY